MLPFPNCNLEHRESAFLNPPPLLSASENPFLCWLSWSTCCTLAQKTLLLAGYETLVQGISNTIFLLQIRLVLIVLWCWLLKYVKVWLNWGFEPFHAFMLAQLFLLIKGDNKPTVDQVSITEIFANWFYFFYSVLEQKMIEMFYGQAEQTTGVYMKTTCENKFLVFPASTAESICHLEFNQFYLNKILNHKNWPIWKTNCVF